jgi:hypothetical protein
MENVAKLRSDITPVSGPAHIGVLIHLRGTFGLPAYSFCI